MDRNAPFITNPLVISEYETHHDSLLGCIAEALCYFYFSMTYRRRNESLDLDVYFLGKEPIYEFRQDLDPSHEDTVPFVTLSLNREFVRQHRAALEERVLRRWLEQNLSLYEVEAEVFHWSRTEKETKRLVNEWTAEVRKFFASTD